MVFEWGGCVPLEHNSSLMSRFAGFDSVALNSGRAALYAAVLDSGAKTVWLPKWLCSTVRNFLEANNIMVREYHVDRNFLPLCDSIAEGELLVWTNWLGCMPSKVKDEVSRRYGERLVYDNCHAYFEKPVRGSYNVYSCRKFLGVPHGAFLVANSLSVGIRPTREAGLEGLRFLEEATTHGSNAVYEEYLAHENGFANGYLAMNRFVQCAVAGVDEAGIAAVRHANFRVLREELGEHAAPGMDLNAPSPVWFPLYVEVEELREALIARHVFVPRLWKQILFDSEATFVESNMARWLLPLPVDQRYTLKDMHELVLVIAKEMKRLSVACASPRMLQ